MVASALSDLNFRVGGNGRRQGKTDADALKLKNDGALGVT